MIKFIYTLKIHINPNFQFLIRKGNRSDLEHFNDFKVFIEYSNDMDDIYKKIEEYNPNEKRKILIVFSDTLTNKTLNPVVTELKRRNNAFIKMCRV